MARKKLTKNDVRRALRKVRTKLLNGKIGREEFNMAETLVPGPDLRKPFCGSIGCIGGYMALELDRTRMERAAKRGGMGGMASALMGRAIDVHGFDRNLWGLFFDFGECKARPNRRRAASAITRALDGAKEPWKTSRR